MTIAILQVGIEVGCAHSICNLNHCTKRLKIPVIFQNMKNYDGHLRILIQSPEKLSNKKKIDAIAQNSDKFINIGFDSLSVKDRFSFITASWDKLVSMTQYDDTDEKDKSKWILRDHWQSNCRYRSKSDIFKTEKAFRLTNWKRSISIWLHECIRKI